MNILLIRHAEKKTDERKAPLTKKGIKQSKSLAKKIKKIKIDEFYCSNLERSKQTSKIVSKKIKIKPKIMYCLNEFDHETMKKDIKRLNKNEKKHLNELKNFLKKVTKYPKSKKTILIIAHGFTNKIVLSHLMNLNYTKLLPFMQHETGINQFYYNPEHKNWRLENWNNFNHLPKRLR